jgi:hypothetical protein
MSFQRARCQWSFSLSRTKGGPVRQQRYLFISRDPGKPLLPFLDDSIASCRCVQSVSNEYTEQTATGLVSLSSSCRLVLNFHHRRLSAFSYDMPSSKVSQTTLPMVVNHADCHGKCGVQIASLRSRLRSIVHREPPLAMMNVPM